MSKKCAFQYDDGRECRCWVQRGSNFCNNHQPPVEQEVRWHETDEHLHPLARLATPEDLFDVIRETLNAARQGRIAPGQAYAVGYLAQVYLQLHKELDYDYELESESRPMPLPVKIDEAASLYPEAAGGGRRADAPPPPRSAEEAAQRMREGMAKLPPLYPEEAEGDRRVHTPEQRVYTEEAEGDRSAELHRQVAEIKARSDARLAAVHPEAAEGGRRAAAARNANSARPDLTPKARNLKSSDAFSGLFSDADAANESASPSASSVSLKPRTSNRKPPVKLSRADLFAAAKKLIRDSGGIFPDSSSAHLHPQAANGGRRVKPRTSNLKPPKNGAAKSKSAHAP